MREDKEEQVQRRKEWEVKQAAEAEQAAQWEVKQAAEAARRAAMPAAAEEEEEFYEVPDEEEVADIEEAKQEEARQALFAMSIDVRNRAQKKVGDMEQWRAMSWSQKLAAAKDPDVLAADVAEVDPMQMMKENKENEQKLKMADDEPSKALLTACKKGDCAGAAEALAQGADIDCSNSLGFTGLGLACLKGNLEMMEVLMDAGASLRVVLKQGTLLAVCIQFKQPAAAELLLQRRAPVDMGSLQKLMTLQGTEFESKFSNVMNEAVLSLETQDDTTTSRDFLLGQTMQSIMAAKLSGGKDSVEP